MQKIDTQDGLFHDGNPATGQFGTIVTADWLNGVQGELAALVEGQGGTLDANAKNQIASLLFKTQPQFDNSKKLATTEFVQQALGSCAGYVSLEGTNVAITSDMIGKYVTVNAVTDKAVTVKFPSVSSLPLGATFHLWISNNGANATLISPDNKVIAVGGYGQQGSAVVNGSTSASVTWRGDMWEVHSGSMTLKYERQFLGVLGQDGYQKLPSGMILQWCSSFPTSASGPVKWTFPVAFSGILLNLGNDNAGANSGNISVGFANGSPTGVYVSARGTANTFISTSVALFAIGV